MNAGMTVAEVTYSNSILQAPLPDDYTTASPEELGARIVAARRALEGRLLILGHHYQRDEVIRWADARGDSLKLARYAAEYRWARDIVFCGVHFMAESADILSDPDQRVILPDLNAAAPWPTWPTPTTSRSAGKPSEA
jgi:quinolinate synthase